MGRWSSSGRRAVLSPNRNVELWPNPSGLEPYYYYCGLHETGSWLFVIIMWKSQKARSSLCIWESIHQGVTQPTLCSWREGGFRRRRTTIMDHIFTLRILSTLDPLRLSFVHLKQAYSTVWKGQSLGDSEDDPGLMYRDKTSCIRSEGDLSDWFPVHAGDRRRRDR